ncbi:hypothetical protein [Rhodoplanes roseus]|uniref:hypothetical protein n=1 Tax=Rhodoplanes roseus TaxID=29409 RepID=UPI0011B3E94D|nr:hypothetical protein [Rhodoplanes roseus]
MTSDPRDSIRKAAIDAAVTQWVTLMIERNRINARRKELADRDAKITHEIADCAAAARFFGVDFESEAGKDLLRDAWQQRVDAYKQATEQQQSAVATPKSPDNPTPHTQPARPSGEPDLLGHQQSEPRPAQPPRIRDIVLERLRQAGSKGSQAAPIREYVQKEHSAEIHEKTVGMTLYRLSREGEVRREGRNWFIVDKTVNPGVGAPGSESTDVVG